MTSAQPLQGEPLFAGIEDWRSRWLCTNFGEYLHRIERLDVGPDEWREDVTTGPGRAVCGLETRFSIPGILSRMGRARCPRCCDSLAIPHGDGAPGNCDDFEEPGCEEPRSS